MAKKHKDEKTKTIYRERKVVDPRSLRSELRSISEGIGANTKGINTTNKNIRQMTDSMNSFGTKVAKSMEKATKPVITINPPTINIRQPTITIPPVQPAPQPQIIFQPAPQNGQITRRDLLKYGIFAAIAIASTTVGAYVLGSVRRDGNVNDKNTQPTINPPQASSVAPSIINGVYGKRGSSIGQLYLDLQNGTSNADVYLDPDGVEGGVNQRNGIAYEIKLRADNGQIEFRKKSPPNYELVYLSPQQFLREIDPNSDVDVLRLYDNRTNRLIKMVGK